MKKARSLFSETLKGIDLFGHPIEFNFNKKGPTHNTHFGGFFSVFVRSALLAYVILILVKMFSYGNNTERNATFTLVSDQND